MTGEGTSYGDLVYDLNLNDMRAEASEFYGVGFQGHPAPDGQAHRAPMSNEIITLVKDTSWPGPLPCRRSSGRLSPS